MHALVVGAGHMGKIHARALRDLGYRVSTVDPHAPADYRTIAEALAACEYDVACLACPPQYLVGYGALLAGMDMLIEKPFARNLQEARLLAQYLEREGGRVCVGFVERFNPRVRDAYEFEWPADLVRARFVRWSDRPSEDVRTDLLMHDVDLRGYLGIFHEKAEFDTRADQPRKVRRIEFSFSDGTAKTFDLMDHDLSPVHAMWHAFLSGRNYPRPRAAIWAHAVLEATAEQVAA